ncbi:MAG: Smr/MutS family protein [Polyangiales bacterium]
MARRRKRERSEDEQPAKPASAPDATTSLGSLLKAANVQVGKKPAAQNKAKGPVLPPAAPPKPPSSARDPGLPTPASELRMLNDAYTGVRPLAQKPTRQIVSRPHVPSRRTDEERADEQAARKRLAELVSGGVHFKVQREDAFVRAFRSNAASKTVDKLTGQGFSPEATLDLHGERTARLSDTVSAFVRQHHRRGARHLLIIVGKGLHSEDGTGVLLSALIEALTHGLCAPLVRGFATAHQRLGGTGAVAVLLI